MCVQERMIVFRGSSITSVYAPSFCFVFKDNLPLFPEMSISSFPGFAQRFAKRCCFFLFRTLNEKVVDEVNGSQAAVSGKQIRNHRKSTVLFLLPWK